MNGPSPKFWLYLKRTMLLLAALSIIAAVIFYLTLTGLQKTFFALCALIIAANFLFVYTFVRINDARRPDSTSFERRLSEEKEAALRR